ncbi:MAG: GYF domain-containing protein [Pseudobdellovibrionaceae bacterium]
MSDKKYFLSVKGIHEGPFSESQILEKLEKQTQQWTDYVFDESKHEWIMLLEHPDFSLKLTRPQWKTESAKSDNPFKVKEWFVLRGQNNYGPFCKLEVVQMMQEKTLHEYDFIWNHKMTTWTRIADVAEFSFDAIKNMKESSDEDMSDVFFRRRHVRAQYGASLLIHDNKKVFKGKSFEISVGGAGLLIEANHLEPGQTLFLHFKPGDGVPPFNAICEVVSKQHAKPQLTGEGLRYGVKFKTVPAQVKENLQKYIEKTAA